ncbi:MAG TPA: hypothetical protein VG295_01790 [Solirubrobacteraceae bacterium]|nr:hypothetical protein [Solirubrobacteraceae bacterium]
MLGALAAALCAGCGGGGSSSTSQGLGRSLATIFQDQPHILSDPVGTLDTFRSLGVTDVRISIGWTSLAPAPTSRTRPPGFNATSPAAYAAAQWAPYDAAVRAAAARGINVSFLLTGPAPVWAAVPAPRGTATHNPGVYEPSATQFGDFVTAVGTRYDGHYTPPGSSSPLPAVTFWSIWDEPNYGYQLAPQAIGTVEVSPYLYRELLDSAWAALHGTGHGADTILIGETAPRGANVPGVANGMVPLRFLRALYCVDSSYRELRGAAAAARRCPTTAAASARFRAQNPGLFAASGFAVHLYTPGQVGRPDLASPANEPDYAGLADLPSLQRALDRLRARYGVAAPLPVYNTEFGFQTNPPPSTCGCVFLSPTSAAYYLNWSEYIEWRDGRLRSDAQYLLYDAPGPPSSPSLSGFSSGLLFLNGTPKPTYAAFRLPLYLPVTSTRRGRALGVWGYVRPARYAERDTGSVPPAEIQFRPGSRGAWRTLRTVTVTGSASAFEVPVRFSASGSVRLRWTYPKGFADLPASAARAVTSRVQRITVR